VFESSNVCRVKDIWFFSGTMINPKDIVAFMESETAKECETILGNPPKTELEPNTFFKVRDYFPPGTPASSVTKIDRHHIPEILLKRALNQI
jgi:hypothetical protein